MTSTYENKTTKHETDVESLLTVPVDTFDLGDAIIFSAGALRDFEIGDNRSARSQSTVVFAIAYGYLGKESTLFVNTPVIQTVGSFEEAVLGLLKACADRLVQELIGGMIAESQIRTACRQYAAFVSINMTSEEIAGMVTDARSMLDAG